MQGFHVWTYPVYWYTDVIILHKLSSELWTVLVELFQEYSSNWEQKLNWEKPVSVKTATQSSSWLFVIT